MVVTRVTRVIDLLQEYPETRPVFESHGMACMTCMGAVGETVEESALMHHLDADQLVRELNLAIVGTQG